MLKIGEFSVLTQVPVKTLRYYDELRPLRASGVISSVTNIQPGRTERVYTVFLVAPDSVSFRVTQRRPPCA